MANVQTDTGSNGGGMHWQDLDPARSNMFVKPEIGLVVQGELLGRFPRFDGIGNYYQIKLTKPCKVKQDKKEISAKAGDVVNVDEKAQLTGLAALCGDTRYAVELTYVEQKATKKGGKVWILQKRYASLGKHAAGVTTPDRGTSIATMSDTIPF